MPSTESRLAETKARHFRERDEFESRFAREKDTIKADADKERHATLMEHRKQSNSSKYIGRSKVHVPTDAEHKRHLEEKFAEVDARRARERKPLDERHKAEIAAVTSGKPSASGPAQRPGRDDPAYEIWDRLSAAQRERWHAIKAKFAKERESLDHNQGASKERTKRYSGSYSHAYDENSHAEVNKRENRELERLAATLDGDLESHTRRAHEQAHERAQLSERHARENRAGR
jgi:hypothetical protein